MSWYDPRSWVGGPAETSTSSKGVIERTLDGIAIIRTQHSVAPTTRESLAVLQAEVERLDKATIVKEGELKMQNERAAILRDKMQQLGRAHPETPSLMRQYTSVRKSALATEEVLKSVDNQRSQLHQQQMILERKMISDSTEKTLETVSLTMAEFKDSSLKLESNMDIIEDAADSVEDSEAVMERPLGSAASWDMSIHDELDDIFGAAPIVIPRAVPKKTKAPPSSAATSPTTVDETDPAMLLAALSMLPDVPSTSPPERPSGPVRHLAEPIAVGAPSIRVVRDKKEIERLRAQAKRK